jgi:hypothetical protein
MHAHFCRVEAKLHAHFCRAEVKLHAHFCRAEAKLRAHSCREAKLHAHLCRTEAKPHAHFCRAEAKLHFYRCRAEAKLHGHFCRVKSVRVKRQIRIYRNKKFNTIATVNPRPPLLDFAPALILSYKICSGQTPNPHLPEQEIQYYWHG